MAKKASPILPAALKRAEHGRSAYTVTLPEGVGASDLKDSDFWVHLASKLDVMDHIEAITADGETYFELVVGRVEKITDGVRTVRIPKLAVLHEVKLGPESKAAQQSREQQSDNVGFSPPVEADGVRNQQQNAVVTGDPVDGDGDGVPDGYTVNFGGPTHKYRVLKDGLTDPLATGMTKKEATAWAWDHARKSA